MLQTLGQSEDDPQYPRYLPYKSENDDAEEKTRGDREGCIQVSMWMWH